MRIAIVGNGAIGNLLALKCEQTGQHYCLVTRDGAPFELTIHDLMNQSHRFQPPVASINHPIDADIIILPLKAYQIETALRQLKGKIKTSTTIVLLHNGMGCAEIAKQMFGQHAIVAATTSYACYKATDVETFETGSGTTEAGWVQQTEQADEKAISSLLNQLIPPLTWYDDVYHPLWKKVSVNAVINPLTAIYQIKNGQLSDQQFTAQITELCTETARVMEACGFQSEPSELELTVRKVIDRTASNYSSMNRDIANRKPSEIEFINGYIVAKARQTGVHVPNHEALLIQINALEDAY